MVDHLVVLAARAFALAAAVAIAVCGCCRIKHRSVVNDKTMVTSAITKEQQNIINQIETADQWLTSSDAHGQRWRPSNTDVAGLVCEPETVTPRD